MSQGTHSLETSDTRPWQSPHSTSRSQNWMVMSCPFLGKYNPWCPFRLWWITKVIRGISKFACLRLGSVKGARGLHEYYFWWGQLDAMFGQIDLALTSVSYMLKLDNRVQHLLIASFLFFSFNNTVFTASLQFVIFQSFGSRISVQLIILRHFTTVMNNCNWVRKICIHSFLLLSWGVIAAWTRRKIPPSRSVSTLTSIPFRKNVGFFEKFKTNIEISMCDRHLQSRSTARKLDCTWSSGAPSFKRVQLCLWWMKQTLMIWAVMWTVMQWNWDNLWPFAVRYCALISTYDSDCTTITRSEAVIYSDVIAIGRKLMGKYGVQLRRHPWQTYLSTKSLTVVELLACTGSRSKWAHQVGQVIEDHYFADKVDRIVECGF